MNQQDSDGNRRSFFKNLFSAVATVGVASAFIKEAKAQDADKVKMLTPDGKLVEVDRSLVEKEITARASNEELKNWMKK